MTGRASPVLLDFESRSRAKLKDVGGRRYWEHPSTEALCCVAHDTRDHTWHLWLPGDPTPDWARGNRVLAAHNMAMFDRFGCIKYGWRAAHWLDTSHLARRAGLPGGLDQLGKRWLGRDKDATGHTLTLALSRVSTARKRAGQWQTEVTPEVLARVVAYCEADVAILVDAWPRLARWLDVDEGARRMNAIINDRGIGFDSQLAKRLIAESDRLADDAIATAAVAWGESTETTRKLVMHPPSLAELLGLPDATRPTLLDARTREWGDDRERVGALIDARLAASSIAKGKLLAGLARVCPDGRMRDSLRYYGGHTGRESSIGMQLHNLPRPHGDFDAWTADQIEDLAERVLAGQHATDREVGLLIRACLVADGEFAVCDFSGVEARALAWMSGDRAAVRVFGAGRDVYKVFASTIFGVPYEQVDKTQRGAGKIGELACGYQMGWRKLERDKGEQLARAGSSAKAVVAAWRDLHSPSVALWYELEDAWQAAAMGETPPPVGDGMLADAGVGIQCLPGEGEDAGSVAIVLPSGRPLIYPDARVDLGRKGRREGSYLGSAKGMREHVYGGMLVENVDQAICRDELMRALEAAEDAGLNPVLDVHDEIVCDVPRGAGAEALDELHAIMIAKSEWMTGMPLAAEGFVSRRYRK